MYFVYFTVFVLMVFVPIIVTVVLGIPSLGQQEVIEVTLILLLGTIGFAMYLWQEKRFRLNFRKRVSVQRESNRIFKDLSEAYLYIGEVNRKLEIMKGIARNIAENCTKKGILAYVPFFQAFGVLAKSKKIIIQFLDVKNHQVLGEVKTDRKLSNGLGLSNRELLEKPENFFEIEERIVAKSPQSIDGVIAVVIIHRVLASHRIDDPEMMKSLTSQVLQLFILAGRKVI